MKTEYRSRESSSYDRRNKICKQHLILFDRENIFRIDMHHETHI